MTTDRDQLAEDNSASAVRQYVWDPIDTTYGGLAGHARSGSDLADDLHDPLADESLRSDLLIAIYRAQLTHGIAVSHAGREAIADAVLAVPAIAGALTAGVILRRVEELSPSSVKAARTELGAKAEPLEPFGTWQEQAAAMPAPEQHGDCFDHCQGHPDDDYMPAAHNRDQETT